MKHTLIPLLVSLIAYHSSFITSSAAVPLKWTVETSANPQNPATFDQFAGATYDLEATLQSRGKPLAVSGDPKLYWQTNGMGSAWWTAPATVSGNVLRATWTPACDVGARVYNCFIGITGTVYNAAFQLRLRPSPGALPNELPLPTPVIDFAKVTVLNPPWSGGGSGGVDTNAVLDIIHKTVEGSARYTPNYLWVYDCDDTYPEDAAWYYRTAAVPAAACSAVRDGGFLYRNYDWHFDSSAEFIVRVSSRGGDIPVAERRYASIGVANCGTNLTEAFVTSGKPSRYYKCLPGRVVDGINENGVVCEVNVVDGIPQWRSGVLTASDIHPLAAVRWALDNGTSAGMVASNLAARIKFPTGWTQNFHWMLADERETWIVENGAASNVTAVAAKRVMTNFPILPDTYSGMGRERYQLLHGGEPITNAWFTRAYSRSTVPAWESEFKDASEMEAAMSAWETHTREELRGKGLWQTVHCSIYDITNRTLRVAVQETDDWYTFSVPPPSSAAGGSSGTNTNDVKALINSEVGGTNAVKEAVAAVANKIDKSGGVLDVDAGLTFRADTPDGAFSKRISAQLMFTGHDPVLFSDFGGTFTLLDWYSLITFDMQTLPDYLSSGEWNTAPDPFAHESEIQEAKTAANEANVWSSFVYNFMNGGRTNCWFSGTNYVFGAEAATRQHFAWEDGMDDATVPCSMALWEIRDGARQLVWDQRDWTAWYWSFKAAQMTADMQGRIDALGNAVTNAANYAWSKRYASDGTPNPDASTTFIDTPSVTLSPGMKWETVATVSGAAYWTLVGNGAVIGGTGTNAVLRIMDFEGNDIMTVTKGEHRLAWLEQGDITDQMYDSDGWVCFDMLADAEPIGYFSTTLEMSDFLPQTDQNCPAQYRWENIGGGKYRVHFLLKPGIQANACFAKFQVEVEGQTVIRYNAGQEISGGLIYNGVKIAPDISGSPAVGTVIQWKVVR